MATTASENFVQQLYVAYYGRPADQAGLQYWADRADDEGQGAIINAFGESQEYQDNYGDMSNANLVNNLYQQLFDRAADPDGLAYYTGVLERGEKSLAEIAVTIKNAAQGIDQQTFNAKVEAADEYTDANGSAEFYDVTAAKAAIDDVDPGVYAPGLTGAIEELQAANEARSTFLQEEAVTNEQVVADLEDANIDPEDASDTDIATSVGDAFEAAVSQMDGLSYVSGFGSTPEATSSSVRAAIISETETTLDQNLASAQAAVADVDGLQSAINSMLTNETRYESALKAEAQTEAALSGEVAKFEALNSDGTATFTANADGTVNYDADGSGSTSSPEAFLKVNSNGQIELASGFDASSYEDLNALISSSQAQYDADAATTKQQTALDNSVTNVEGLDATTDSITVTTNPDNTVDLTYSPASGETSLAGSLATAKANIAEFDAAVAEYTETKALSDDLGTLDKAIEDAQSAFADMDIDLGGNDATLENDLFIFDESQAVTTIADFGVDGDDQLYIGTGFTRSDLDADADLGTEAHGSSSVQEVFFQQGATGAELSFEADAFSGNSKAGFDGSVITLTGVNVDDLQLENGYISIA